MSRVGIIHGHQLIPDPTALKGYRLDDGYINIIKAGAKLIEERKIDILLFVGGVTVEGLPAESVAGSSKLYEMIGVTKANSVRIVTEERSTTFSENVQFGIKKLADQVHGIEFEHAYLIARRSAERVKFLYGYFWPETVAKAMEYVPIDVKQSHLDLLKEWVLLKMAKRDPAETGKLITLLKTFTRNLRGNQKLAVI